MMLYGGVMETLSDHSSEDGDSPSKSNPDNSIVEEPELMRSDPEQL